MTALQEKLAAVKLLVLDFDGVLTDNQVYVMQDGSEMVRCYRGDGIGIERLKAAGVRVVVLSGESNPVVQVRCQKLGIPAYIGVNGEDKRRILFSLVVPCSVSEMAYVGNDLNDLQCLTAVGVPIVTADCEVELLRKGFYRTTRAGGMGAVREVCDLIADAKLGFSPESLGILGRTASPDHPWCPTCLRDLDPKLLL